MLINQKAISMEPSDDYVTWCRGCTERPWFDKAIQYTHILYRIAKQLRVASGLDRPFSTDWMN